MKTVKIWYLSFLADTFVPLTPERIRQKGLLIAAVGEEDYAELMRHIRLEIPIKGRSMLRYDREMTRLCIESSGAVYYVDNIGVVKSNNREYVLQPRAFLKIFFLLESYSGVKESRRG